MTERQRKRGGNSAARPREHIFVSGVCERDIDLMLLEEFVSSKAFQRWFATEVTGRSVSPGQLITAQRSVTQTSGESDLEVSFRDRLGQEKCYLIENKVNAGLQRDQASRYRRRGEGYVALRKCAAFHTVLVAPSRYFGKRASKKGFDSAITYEKLLGWFAQAKYLADRRRYKVSLLRSAIEKGSLGYQFKEDAPVTSFWKEYWKQAVEHAEELSMKKPGDKPARSSFIYFRPETLPKGIEVCHKFAHGHVDLQVNGFGKRINELHKALDALLPDGADIVEAGQSAVIRIKVPPLDPARSFAEQATDARVGLEAARALHRWYREKARAAFESLRKSRV